MEVRELWEPGEWNGQISLPQPCLPQSSFVSGDFAFRDPDRVQVRWGGAGDCGMGNDYLFNNSKKDSKPLKGLNSPAETGIL